MNMYLFYFDRIGLRN